MNRYLRLLLLLLYFFYPYLSSASIYIDTGKKVAINKIKSTATYPISVFGEGVLEILEASDYNADTFVHGRILLSTVDSSIGTVGKKITVLANGHISGSGTLIGDVQNYGQLEPIGSQPSLSSSVGLQVISQGSGAGTLDGSSTTIPESVVSQSNLSGNLKIQGNYKQYSGARLSLDVSPDEQESLRIYGYAQFMGGEIEISPIFGEYPTQANYRLLVSWAAKIGNDPDISITNSNAQIVYRIDNDGLWGALIALPTDRIEENQNVNISALQNIDTASTTVEIPESVTIHASRNQNQSIDKPVIFSGSATIKPSLNSVVSFSKPITSFPDSQLLLQGSGTTKISANTDNTQTLKSPIVAKQTNLTIEDQANLGKAQLTLESSTLTLSNTTLSNPITVAQPSTIATTDLSRAVLESPLFGDKILTISGNGRLELKGDSQYFTGTLDATQGELKINADFSQSKVIIQDQALMSGSSTLGSVDHHGVIKPGNSIGTVNIIDNYQALANPRYSLEINSQAMSDLITVQGSTILAQTLGGSSTYSVDVLMDQGDYKTGVTNYKILKSKSDIQGIVTHLTWHDQGMKSDGVTPIIKFEIGTYLQKYLLLKSTINQDFTINTSQTEPGTKTVSYTNHIPNNTESMLFGELEINPGEAEGTYFVPPPVLDQPELTSIVFSKSNIDQEIKSPLSDTFRFQSSSASRQSMSIDQSLSALSKIGPVSIQKKELRLWISPFFTRRRFNGTYLSSGNQGWGGGALAGIERRNDENTYTLGLLTGLMNSKSSKLSQPNTHSKVNALILGAYHVYKYWDDPQKTTFTHELLASHTISQIKGQRYGVDSITKIPYLAQSNHRSHTSLFNGQLNYIINVIPREVSLRLDSGYTYSRNYEGRYRENNASTNNINYSRNSVYNHEFYNGIGIRKTWDDGSTILRTTAVYEYGYVMKAKNSGSSISLQNIRSLSYGIQPDKQHHKHYVQLNGSFLQRQKGIKLSLSYSGTFSHQLANHTTMFKIEHRF